MMHSLLRDRFHCWATNTAELCHTQSEGLGSDSSSRTFRCLCCSGWSEEMFQQRGNVTFKDMKEHWMSSALMRSGEFRRFYFGSHGRVRFYTPATCWRNKTLIRKTPEKYTTNTLNTVSSNTGTEAAKQEVRNWTHDEKLLRDRWNQLAFKQTGSYTNQDTWGNKLHIMRITSHNHRSPQGGATELW